MPAEVPRRGVSVKRGSPREKRSQDERRDTRKKQA
jgi:hypothetical protein